MGLRLSRALRLMAAGDNLKAAEPVGSSRRTSPAIAFVGAGGKTTAMFQLARQMRPPVVVTTTTHLGAWQLPLADQHFVAESLADLAALELQGVTLITGPVDASDKVAPVSEAVAEWLHDMARESGLPLLIEADGGHQRPLKAPAAHEPAIPGFVDLVVCVAGLSGLGKPLTAEYVHRPEIFGRLSGLRPDDQVSGEALVKVMTHAEGGLKSVPRGARRVALLNQVDSPDLQAAAGRIAQSLLPAFEAVIIASLQSEVTHAVCEPVAGILLAAGGSRRLGRPKALLDWNGEPFVRAAATTALRAGLERVVVVTGSSHKDVSAALDGLPVVLVHNPDWETGQASSIRAGISALPSSAGAAVFLLADQPQVTEAVLRALVDAHAASLSPIVAPLVRMDRRANPVLFDRDTFADLLALQGDVGGRAIFSKHPIEYVPWHDERLLLDVDTEADCKRLVEDETL